MKDIEIPYKEEKGRRYRFFEMLPGLITWTILIMPFLLSWLNPTLCVLLIITYLLIWFAKSAGLTLRSVQGLRIINQQSKLPWGKMLQELAEGKTQQPDRTMPAWHYENIRRLQETPPELHPDDIIHAIIVATYNEAREVLEPTIKSVKASAYDMKKVILVLAYEERGGADVDIQARQLIDDYRGDFMAAMAIKHPKDMPGEVIGKGGNITYAGRKLAEYLESKDIEPDKVIVTTLDADNRPHKNFLAALSYLYMLAPDPSKVSFQPVPIFTNNIWDVPAPMRVIATGNTFWNVVLTMRPHMIRNFSSHAQTMRALIDTDFWSVRTIVEDGHQFWRTYFRYDGKHDVYPMYIPIYQDAVLSSNYRKTFKAQFVQIRRWAWGASDIAYVLEKGFFKPNKVPKFDLVTKFFRLLEGHISWATAPLLLAFAAFIPAFLNSDDFASNNLPIIASRIQTIALLGIFATLFLSLKLLPPKPARYRRHKHVFMVVQWVMLPVTTILFNSMAAINSQTRLLFGWHLGRFDVTEKAVITDDKKRIM